MSLAEHKPANPAQTPQAALLQQRAEKVAALRQQGCEPYANDFRVSMPLGQFVARFAATATFPPLAEIIAQTTAQPEAQHALAGRVVAINTFGKTAFLRLVDGYVHQPAGLRLQLYLRRDTLPATAWESFQKLDVGDFVGVSGAPMRTKTNELSLLVTDLRILTKTLRPLPEKWHGLTDVETRYRQRYLDLLANPSVRQTFIVRSRLLSLVRQFLQQRDFLEVETPMMHSLAGGAAAKPFKTHHNALDLDLYLRIAPELYLKRLVVGGYDRVFEINRNFRNEGISSMHNPEFTMLEFYQAYACCDDLLPLLETLLCELAATLCPPATPLMWQGQEIKLQPPFQRFTMLQAITHFGGPPADVARHSQQAAEHLETLRYATAGKSSGELVLMLFEHYAEPHLLQPTFITDFPADVSPLARRQTQDPYFVERFELYVAGRELANGFSELNDPVEQRARFVQQQAQRQAGNDEAHAIDDDYVRALEYGLPPTAGCGIGIDRLVMLLTNATSIRDVLLFPLLRPTPALPPAAARPAS